MQNVIYVLASFLLVMGQIKILKSFPCVMALQPGNKQLILQYLWQIM